MRDPWHQHLDFEPEEARALGLPATGTKDLQRRAEQLDLFRALGDCGAPALERRAALALADAEAGRDLLNLERSLFPHLVDTPEVDRFLAQHEAQLEQALDAGLRPDRELVEHFLHGPLPAARDAAPAAQRPSWERHLAFYGERLRPAAAPGQWRLGERAYRQRLAALGRRRPLAPDARRVLGAVHDRLAATLGTDSVAAALRRVAALRVPPASDPQAAYRAANARLVDFVRASGLAALPADFVVPLRALPAGMAAVTHAGNVPAPLFGAGDGAFEVLDDPDRHMLHAVAPLAAHEGVPGHYLQSWHWRQRFRGPDAPVPDAFVSISDAIAAERQDWGAMVAIEGWAVFAESLVLAADFHTPEAAALALSFQALRCVRALVDEELHCGTLDDAGATRLYEHAAGLDPAEAARELWRHKRVPTQPATYFIGWQTIEALLASSALPRDEAVRRLLGAGPVLPATLDQARVAGRSA